MFEGGEGEGGFPTTALGRVNVYQLGACYIGVVVVGKYRCIPSKAVRYVPENNLYLPRTD